MSNRFTRSLIFRTLAVLALLTSPATAGEALIAVASNFVPTIREIVRVYEADTGHELRVTNASTGKLFAQVMNGAPFDVYLAADEERPRRLAAAGLAVESTRRTYALGRLVLYSADAERLVDREDAGIAVLRAGAFRRLALAHPELAPYGVAARQVLAGAGLEEALEDKLVLGENIGQAYGLVATGNAELGFIALSQYESQTKDRQGSAWVVPASLHSPIRQDGVLLSRAAENEAAIGFLEFMASAPARALIRRAGYEVE